MYRADFHDSLIVRKGIEICEPHQDQEGYMQIFFYEPMDFILGSVHNVSTRKLRFLNRTQSCPGNQHIHSNESK